ncbi:Wac domain-containing protein [Colletotrichum sp. SAR 10_99]|nr:Wac domain-containing protein [Colletotrichum sp. SAR 10_96]KAJ5005290.1 Wac domain-containing protein [Colletotrichum sp. SAR 10_99]
MATVSTTSSYVTWDDLKRFRNPENQRLQADVTSVKQSIQSVQQQLTTVDDIETRVSRIEQQISESEQRKATMLQTMSTMRNFLLRNPSRPVHAVVAYHDGAIVEPDPAKFPKNADEFYSLRCPKTNRQRGMLNYLIGFYDIADLSFVPDNELETINKDETAVSVLEDILGLNEDHFIEFRRKAAELANRSKNPPQKRRIANDTDNGARRQPTFDDARERLVLRPDPGEYDIAMRPQSRGSRGHTLHGGFKSRKENPPFLTNLREPTLASAVYVLPSAVGASELA